MEQGIVCKVWNIKGTTDAKGAIDQLRDSLGYILNDEKTVFQSNLDPLNQLTRECKYVENDLKTFSGAFVGGNNVSTTNVLEAVSEMMEVKRFYGKEDGRAALHMIISLPEEESDVSNASKLMQLCDSVVKEVFPKNQAIYAVHTNTENLHIHVIVNSVGLDGKKIHQNDKFMREILHPCVNKYASVYGFTQNPKWKTASQSNLSFPEIKMSLRSEIDRAIENSDSFEDFIAFLRKKNISVHVGKHISLLLPELNKPIRTHNLGNNYTRDAIVERILTRKEKFMVLRSGNYVPDKRKARVYIPTTFKMPKYKDMTEEQKKNTLHLLRLGRNPWRENRQMNWQLNRIADDLNAKERISTYIDFYSRDGSIQSALEGMIEAKKQAHYDKKLVAFAKRKYKPILDIYEQMAEIEKRSYLYEHKGHKEYRAEFEQYRNMTKRLKDGYNKDIFEVATFLEECNERLLYAQAQINEISEEYRELQKYAKERGYAVNDKEDNLIDLVGYYSDKEKIKRNTADVDAYYIASPRSDVLIKVVKHPTLDQYGHLIELYEITVEDSSGRIIKQITGSDREREFRDALYKLQSDYELTDCKQFTNKTLAKEYYKSSLFSSEDRTGIRDSKRHISFTQAVNHVSDEKPVNVIVNSEHPSYTVLVTKENERIKVVVFNASGKVEEMIRLPVVNEKNSSGFEKLIAIMDKYDFHDEVKEYKSMDDAKQFRESKEAVKGRMI